MEELQKVRRQSQAVREDIAKELAVAATADDKENIPKNGDHILPADLIEKKSVEEQKRRASYGVVKNVLEQDSVHRKVDMFVTFCCMAIKTGQDRRTE